MQLQAERPRLGQSQRGQLLEGQIPAQIAMEFPVVRVAGIAILGGPHRQGRFAVAAEEGDAVPAADRCVDPVARPRPAMQQPMGIKHRIAKPGVAHPVIQAFVVGAFG